MNACFFCTTPFQIITAVSMCPSLKENADLYIIDQFSNAELYAGRIQNLGLFSYVKVVHEKEVYSHKVSRNRFITHLRIAKSYLKVDEFAEKVLIPGREYDQLYFSSKAYIARMVMLYYIKRKVKMNADFIDDGEGSYTNNAILKPSLLDSVVRFLIFGKKGLFQPKTKHLYSPELYYRLNGKTEEEVIGIECSWKSKVTREKLNYIFDYDKSKAITEEVVVLDSLYDENQRKIVDDLYLRLAKKFGREQVIIKKHPRDKEMSISDLKQYTTSSIPFEVLCMNMDIDNKLFVCESSTAVIMPKLLLDEEASIILFYRILGKTLDQQRDVLYQECRNLYREPRKIRIVEDLPDYDKALREFGAFR